MAPYSIQWYLLHGTYCTGIPKNGQKAQIIPLFSDKFGGVSKFYVTLPDNKMLASGRNIFEEFILCDSVSTGAF